VSAGVVSNISQCQITRICAIARARSRKVSCAAVYLFNIYFLVTFRFKVRVMVSCRVRCRANLILRVTWQCDIFGMTPAIII